MDGLILGAGAANRASFHFRGPRSVSDTLLATAVPTDQLTLAGRSEKLDAAHWPVRGDLAHIALAGRCFVPHYAVPMPHRVLAGGADLLAQGQVGAEPRGHLAAGEVFDVLDMAGHWAWGIMACPDGANTCGISGLGGLVGYVPLDRLSPLS